MNEKNVELKMGTMVSVMCTSTRVIEKKDCMGFSVDGVFENKEFTLEIYISMTKDELFRLPLNNNINLLNRVIGSTDLTFSDGPSLLEIFELKCMQYLPGKFLLKMFFRAGNDIVGNIAIDFNLVV